MASTHRAQIVYHPDLLMYDFGPNHPLRPERIDAGLDLIEQSGLWIRERDLLLPEPAEPAELALVHSQEYIRAVEAAGAGKLSPDELIRFGFGSADNPAFPDMHYASSLVAGGAVHAARQIMNGQLDHAFHPAGGLHHALRARASGFCIYNDPAVAAAVVSAEYGARVLYIDLDCHHGDGVQWIFYSDPRVFTLSFHESGEFLFPGTGDTTEIGEGDGVGYCVNVPFYPYTQDGSWQLALDLLLPVLVDQYVPDLIISNHGCDTHFWDPLTHLELTTDSFRRQAVLIHRLAHDSCDGRWLAVGSGGYDWRRVVPRSWSILWAEMTCRDLPDVLPSAWTSRWLIGAERPAPELFLDAASAGRRVPAAEKIESINLATIRAAEEIIRGLN